MNDYGAYLLRRKVCIAWFILVFYSRHFSRMGIVKYAQNFIYITFYRNLSEA